MGKADPAADRQDWGGPSWPKLPRHTWLPPCASVRLRVHLWAQAVRGLGPAAHLASRSNVYQGRRPMGSTPTTSNQLVCMRACVRVRARARFQ